MDLQCYLVIPTIFRDVRNLVMELVSLVRSLVNGKQIIKIRSVHVGNGQCMHVTKNNETREEWESLTCRACLLHSFFFDLESKFCIMLSSTNSCPAVK